MPPSFNRYLDRFATIFFLILLAVALWLFWSNLLVAIVPDLTLPFIVKDPIKQRLSILYYLGILVIALDYFNRRFFTKIDFGWAGIILICAQVLEPIIRIVPQLLKGNSLASIINTYPILSDDIVTTIFIVMLFGTPAIFIFIDKKINNN